MLKEKTENKDRALENYIAEPPTKGIATESMGVVNTGQMVKRIWEGASAFAFVREFVENSLQAGATKIEIGPDWVGLKTYQELGMPLAYKLMFSDNGEGIPRSKMKVLLNNLASSGRDMSIDGNFGIGAKVSSLPWNPFGIVFMSWTKSEEGMIRLFRKHDGNYGVMRWNESDEGQERFNDLTVPPADYRESFQKQSGTNVVLFGKDQAEDTLLGPPDQKAGLHVILHVLNDRYFQFPENTKVSVCVFPNGNKAKWPKTKSEAKNHYKQAKGAKWYLDTYSKESGTIKTQGAKLHWWWHPDLKSTNFEYAGMPGYVGAMYNNELYDVVRRSKTQTLQCITTYAKFGLFFEDVYRNVTILVEPNKATENNPGVSPDLSRGHLRAADGGALPWDEWGKAFYENMPDVIAKAIATASEGTESNINLEEKLKEFFDRMDIYGADNQRAGGTVDPTSIPRRRASRSTGNGDTAPKTGEFKPTKYHVPARNWVKPSDLATDGDLFQGKAVHYQESANTILFNEDFPLWKLMIDFWVNKYPTNEHGIRKKVQTAVRAVYEAAVITRIVHLRQFRGKPDWTSAAIDRALSNEALTIAVLGIQDADTHIGNLLKGMVRIKRSDAKTHPHAAAEAAAKAAKSGNGHTSWPGFSALPGM